MILDHPPSRTMMKMGEFRYILPNATTTKEPILQQAWRCVETGEVEWESVPTVVVSVEEFERSQPRRT